MGGSRVTYLQERDRLLMTVIYEQHFVETDQIARFFFREATRRRALQRIQVLEKAGILRREEHFYQRGRSILRLTQHGTAVVEQNRAALIPQRTKLDVRTLVHDGLVTATRLRLQELWDGVWIPESLIKAEEFPHIPDGILVFPNRRQVAVEVENTPKGPERFREIQERWRRATVRLVLCVVPDATMLRIVRRYLESGPQDLPFGLVHWEALKDGVPLVWTVMGELDLFSRRSL
jgi:hypothetical protein